MLLALADSRVETCWIPKPAPCGSVQCEGEWRETELLGPLPTLPCGAHCPYPSQSLEGSLGDWGRCDRDGVRENFKESLIGENRTMNTTIIITPFNGSP